MAIFFLVEAIMSADKTVKLGQTAWWTAYDVAIMRKVLSDPTSLNCDSKLSDKSMTENT